MKRVVEVNEAVGVVRELQGAHVPNDLIELLLYGRVYRQVKLTYGVCFKHCAELANLNSVCGIEARYSAPPM